MDAQSYRLAKRNEGYEWPSEVSKTPERSITDANIPLHEVIRWSLKMAVPVSVFTILMTILCYYIVAALVRNDVANGIESTTTLSAKQRDGYGLKIAAASPQPLPFSSPSQPQSYFPAPQPPAFTPGTVVANPQIFAQSAPQTQITRAASPRNSREFTIFRDKPQRITTPAGSHQIQVHDFGSETISVSIDFGQAVRIKKAFGSDNVGDNKVEIFNDGRLRLSHVNSPRAAMNCCLIEANYEMN